MYDRRPEAVGESLWSQLQFRAVAGPAAASGRDLDVLPSAVMHWGDWLAAHPETDVLSIKQDQMLRYKKASYSGYFGSDELRFPVTPLPPADGPLKKTPVLVLLLASQRTVVTLDAIAARADADGRWPTSIAETNVTLRYRADPATAWAESTSSDLRTISAFWFAWHAMYPADRLQ
jgi:hypothetical protein